MKSVTGFTVHEPIGIVGPNGCGKTTLLRILGGLLTSDSGAVYRYGTVSCFFGLGAGFHPDLTLHENIYLHSLLHGLSPKEAHHSRDAIITEAELETHRFIPLKCLSLGMLVRLGFASAMAIDSDIYLLDEIVAVGDDAFQKHSMERLHTLKSKGKTAILVSHNPLALEQLCDRTLLMEQGRIL
jgi:ABC-type polysaccharide/polyol phosphate transport system ATPase subunit